jgi:anti-sigma B factor antagonist
MHITHRTEGDVQILTLHGRFDAYEAPQLLGWFNRMLPEGEPRMVVNLGEVPFIDTSGLAALVSGMKQCRQRRGDLRLCCFQQPVRIILELTRMNRAFELFEAEVEAINTPWGQHEHHVR